MSDRSPNLAQALRRVLELRLAELHTAMPAEIVTYDPATQTADVRPLLRQRGVDELGAVVQRELPLFVSVPVVFPGGGGFRMTLPLKPGDGVLVVFSESSLERWQTSGRAADVELRRHHFADAIAIPGLHANTAPWLGASSSALSIGSDAGPGVMLGADFVHLGAREGQPATEAVVLGSSYRTTEDAAADTIGAAATAAAGAMTAAAASLGVAVPLLAVPIVGGLLAAAHLAIVVTQLGIVAAQLSAITAALTAFKTAAAGTLSTIVKTR